MLTYGHDAILPMEIVVPSLRIVFQSNLSPKEFNEPMFIELENMDEVRTLTLDRLQVQKQKVAMAYNKSQGQNLQSRGIGMDSSSTYREEKPFVQKNGHPLRKVLLG